MHNINININIYNISTHRPTHVYTSNTHLLEVARDEELPLDALQRLGGVVVRLEMNERGVCVCVKDIH